MKNSIFLLILCTTLLPLVVYGAITQLSAERMQEIENKLTEFHATTYSQNDPKPDTLQLGDDKLLIAKTDLSDSCRYYSFQTNADVNKLVQAVTHVGWNIAWYYVQRNDVPSIEKLALK